jgi:hypothetical protein
MKMLYTTKKISTEKEMLLRELIWYLPLYIFSYLYSSNKKFVSEEFETKSAYQKAREMRIGSILALCLYHWHGTPHYVAAPDRDPPDLYIAEIDTGSNRNSVRILAVEVTSYLLTNKSLLQQLIDSGKTPKYPHVFDENTIILVNVGVGFSPDYSEVQQYLWEIQAPYEVWCLQDRNIGGTTYAGFTRISPHDIRSDEIEIFSTMKKLEKQEKMERIKFRKSGPSKAGLVEEILEVTNRAPWDFSSFRRG